MKSLVIAAAFATVTLSAFSMPVIADDGVVKPERVRGEHHEKLKGERKEMREGFKSDREEFRKENRAEHEAAKKEFKAKMDAADTPEAKEALLREHRAAVDAKRKEHFDEKTAMIEKHRAEVDAKRAEHKEKREEHRARKAEKAPPEAK